jgi:acetyl-CoA C-acetyltransferase
MGVYAEATSKHYQFTRDAQDAYAIESLRRAKQASEDGLFADEIAPVTIKGRKGTTVVSQDDQPFKADPSKIPNLKPAFAPDGSVTAANSSSISDGAAALVLMPLSEAERRGLAPLALIRGQAGHAHEPRWFTTAPVTAMSNLLDQVGWSANDVDLYEINEAFACVTMAAMHDMNLPHEKVNVHGGACALGHPIGASGARILVTLLNAMKQRDVAKGVASLCIGGGEAVAVAVERVS